MKIISKSNSLFYSSFDFVLDWVHLFKNLLFLRRLSFSPLQLKMLQRELKTALSVMEKYTE
jgi:hypothetical protein